MNMPTRSSLYALVVGLGLAFATPSVGAQDRRRLELEVGEQTTISASGVQRYSEGVGGIVDVRVPQDDPSQFIIVALRAGQTSLLLIYRDGREVRYRITVVDPNSASSRPGTVEARENIRLDLYFVELNESYTHNLGVGFPSSIGGAPTPVTGTFVFDLLGPTADRTPQFTQATLNLAQQVLPRIDFAQASGWARVRRQAMVVTANGTPASFSSGGEVNIQVQGALTAEIRTINFGSQIEVTPRFDAQTGRIEIQIAAQLSELTASSGPENPPGRRVTSLEGVANLQPGQALIMGGLTSRQEREQQGGLPGLSQIPILGVLFGTNSRDGTRTENFLFIVPTIVQAVPRQERDYIREALETYQRFEGGLDDIDLIDTSPPGYGAPPPRRTTTPAARPSVRRPRPRARPR